MRRANMILLVLMGGGLALWSSRPSAECRDARARNLPTADAICGRSGSGYSHGGSGYWGGRTGSGSHWSGGTSAIASVVRGGFGSFHGIGGS